MSNNTRFLDLGGSLGMSRSAIKKAEADAATPAPKVDAPLSPDPLAARLALSSPRQIRCRQTG